MVSVRDFGSKNGTFVNGEQVMPERELKPDDRLAVGQLQFDVRITGQEVGPPKAEEKKPAAAAGKQDPVIDDELDVSQWFGDGDASAATETKVADGTTAQKTPTEDTVQTEPVKDADPDDDDEDTHDLTEAEKEKLRRSKQIVGVSKSRQEKLSAATTEEAASEMLKKLFNGRH